MLGDASAHHTSPVVGTGNRGTVIGNAVHPSGSFSASGQGTYGDGAQRIYSNIGNNNAHVNQANPARRIDIANINDYSGTANPNNNVIVVQNYERDDASNRS